MLANIPLTKNVGDPLPLVSEAPPEYWLYAGLRMGGSLRFYSRPDAGPFLESDVFHWYNINFGIHAAYNFWRFLSVQGELMISSEYAPYRSFDISTNTVVYDDASFSSMSLMVPVTIKASLRKEPLFSASVLGGVYLTFPMSEMQCEQAGNSFSYSFVPPLGYTVGINMGFKAGPGYIFIDVRWAQDFGQMMRDNGDPLFGRSMLILALGYEKGFFSKKKPAPPQKAIEIIQQETTESTEAAESAESAETPQEPEGGEPAP